MLANEINLYEAIEQLTGRCLPFSINTNATRRIAGLAEKLRSSPYARMVQSSVDGPAQIHDRMRGKSGSHDKTLANLSHLSSQGIFVRVVSMLTDDWMEPQAVIEVAQRLSEAGVRDWLLELPNTTGRWRGGVDMKLNEQLCRVAAALYHYLARHDHGFRRAGLNQVFEWPLSQDRHEPSGFSTGTKGKAR